MMKLGWFKLMWLAATSYIDLTSYKVMSLPQTDIQDALRATRLKVAVPPRTSLLVKPWRTSLHLLPSLHISSRSLKIRKLQI